MSSREHEEENADHGFTVSDKRLFTREGQRRETEVRATPPPPPPPPPRSAAAPPDREAAPPFSDPLDTQAPGEMPPADFATYVVMLANTIMMLLGQVPDPVTQQRRLDLVQAKHTIDILMMLEQKTRGNLTSEEEHLLKEVLPQLQMAYVSVSRQAR
jgi:Domain of unknown function (DUF1844)